MQHITTTRNNELMYFSGACSPVLAPPPSGKSLVLCSNDLWPDQIKDLQPDIPSTAEQMEVEHVGILVSSCLLPSIYGFTVNMPGSSEVPAKTVLSELWTHICANSAQILQTYQIGTFGSYVQKSSGARTFGQNLDMCFKKNACGPTVVRWVSDQQILFLRGEHVWKLFETAHTELFLPAPPVFAWSHWPAPNDKNIMQLLFFPVVWQKF